MKDHVKETKYLYSPYDDPLPEFVSLMYELAENLIDPRISARYDHPELIISGWRPMTEKELEKAKEKRAKERKRKKKEKEEKEAAEREELKRLLEKYGKYI